MVVEDTFKAQVDVINLVTAEDTCKAQVDVIYSILLQQEIHLPNA